MVVNYREAYGIHASNGILFNHESPRRGETFVTRKITIAAARIKAGKQDILTLGNLESQRDWGYAPEYTLGMWSMLQQDTPDDYVLATNEMHTVREFVKLSFQHLGITLRFDGEGVDEVGIDESTGRTLVAINPHYYRPTEVEQLLGNAAKAKEKLGWAPHVKFHELVGIMTDADWKSISNQR
jgi:GDPmannose 4,6-dehydratase